MIIIPNRAGQLGNQLFEIAHFAASSIEHGFKVSYLAFEHPLGYFPAINSLPNVRIHVASAERGLCYYRLARGLSMFLPSSPFHALLESPGPPHVDIGSPDFVRKALDKVVICQGFGFRDIANVAKHHDKLARMFRMSDCVRHEVDDFYSKLVWPSNCVVMGFHVRRGDFRSYMGGALPLQRQPMDPLDQRMPQSYHPPRPSFLGGCFFERGGERFNQKCQ
jgi:hypothetical protein